jgi:hypothetical protein
MYSSTLSLTSALDGAGVQRHDPAALLPGKRPGTLFIGDWVGQGQVWTVRKISLPARFDHWILQPIESRYTDYSIPAQQYTVYDVVA